MRSRAEQLFIIFTGIGEGGKGYQVFVSKFGKLMNLWQILLCFSYFLACWLLFRTLVKEKWKASNLYSDRKSLAAREPESGGLVFLGGRAARFMFRARPFVIMAECKQTDIIWRLLHPPGSAIVTHCTKLAKETPRKGRRGFQDLYKGCRTELEWKFCHNLKTMVNFTKAT